MKRCLNCYFNLNKVIISRNENKLDRNGFSLTEIVVVLAIMAIIVLIAVPSFIDIIQEAKNEVCNTNIQQLERMYEIHLMMEDIDHSDAVFVEYLSGYGEDLCPECGEISYIDGTVQCSERTQDNEDGDGGGVPFL